MARLLLFAACLLASTFSLANCADTDKDCAKAAQRDHVVNRLDFWKSALVAPMARRIGPAPAQLIDYVRLDNIANGYAERPTPAVVPVDFQRDLDAALAALPDSIKHALEPRLAGVYLMQGLGSTGFTDKILDAGGRPLAAYVVLDLDVLAGRKANEWATWKENTPFRRNDETMLTASIESAENDNRMNAIQYILLHEFGHVLSVGQNVHPDWWDDAAEVNAGDFPFFSLSWRFSKSDRGFVTHIEDRFPLRRQLAYYGKGKLETGQMATLYAQLEGTDFVSLYAATNPFDDFAESFASYVHTVLMGKPFEIRIARNGGVLRRFGSCWEAARCVEKRRVLEAFIRRLQ